MKQIYHGKYLSFIYDTDPQKNDAILGSIIGGQDFFDDFLRTIYDQYVKKDSTVIEVGAHVGTHTCYLAKLAKHVYAFEPQEALYKHLQANLFVNDCKNVTAYNMACYNKTAILYSEIDLDRYELSNEKASTSFRENSSSDKLHLVTEAYRLDEILLDMENKIDFIKIDAEGLDFRVAQGAEKIIERDRPFIAFEDNNRDIEKWGEYLKKYNYTIRTINDPCNYLAEPN